MFVLFFCVLLVWFRLFIVVVLFVLILLLYFSFRVLYLLYFSMVEVFCIIFLNLNGFVWKLNMIFIGIYGGYEFFVGVLYVLFEYIDISCVLNYFWCVIKNCVLFMLIRNFFCIRLLMLFEIWFFLRMFIILSFIFLVVVSMICFLFLLFCSWICGVINWIW